jgi:hypothetical protein
MPLFRGTFAPSTSTQAGGVGFVPSPAAGKNTRALFSNAGFGEVPVFPKYKNSSTIIRTFNAGASTNFSPSIRLRNFALIYLPADGEIQKLIFRTGASAPSPAYNVNLAFWDCGENGEPSNYLGGGNISSGTSANTNVELTLGTNLNLKNGFYYLSLTPDATGTASSLLRVETGTANIANAYIGGDLANPNFSMQYVTTTYDQTTHEASFGLAATSTPFVGVKYA